MLRQLAARFFYELLECDFFGSEAALQGARAGVQLARDILQIGAPTSEKFFQRALHLFLERLLGELLRELRFELWRDHGEQVGIMREERLLDVRALEDEYVVACAEFHGTLKVSLVDRAIRLRALQFQTLRMNGASRATAADRDNPGEAYVDQGGRL